MIRRRPGSRPGPVAVGISGGVDSAVAAWLLQRQGHEVFGVFMKNWEEDDRDGYCAAAEDLAAAEAVCAHLGIPLRTVNFSAEYWDRVFRHFLAEYGAGRTPNPDVLCNREIKFRAFLEYALGLDAAAIATGHYARRSRAGTWRLLAGVDPSKDQSYFLHLLDQRALARSLFPLGGLTKAEVRRLAAAIGLPNHARRDSTGICFIGERPFREFLERYLPARPGEIRDESGQVVGRHRGLMYYTIGQREGLGIGGRRGGSAAPWYVAGKDLAANRLEVVQGHDHPRLYRHRLDAAGPHWIAETPALPLRCHCRIRHRQPLAACELRPRPGGVEVVFDRPQRAVAPGQSVVFYRHAECLGGAVIQ